MTPPAPSASLRRRILSLAKEVSPEPDPSLVDRVWGSRALRLAWAGLVVALLLGHAALSPEAPAAAPLQGRAGAPATDRHPRLIDVWLDPTLAVWM
jgi:hypothetical protein